jgi:hypothetical protein
VRPYQIVVPVSVIAAKGSPEFPAILDPGHTHNFAMSAEHFRDWVRLKLRRTGTLKINQQEVALYEADVRFEGRRLSCPEGIAVYPPGHPRAPRLPVLGLRVLVRNRVRVLIDGVDVTVG